MDKETIATNPASGLTLCSVGRTTKCEGTTRLSTEDPSEFSTVLIQPLLSQREAEYCQSKSPRSNINDLSSWGHGHHAPNPLPFSRKLHLPRMQTCSILNSAQNRIIFSNFRVMLRLYQSFKLNHYTNVGPFKVCHELTGDDEFNL